MSFDQLSSIGFGTALLVVVFAGIFIFKRALRERLFPGPAKKDREAAMTELLLFQAQLDQGANKGSGSEREEEEVLEGDAGEPGAGS
jgi:hypothetical protein